MSRQIVREVDFIRTRERQTYPENCKDKHGRSRVQCFDPAEANPQIERLFQNFDWFKSTRAIAYTLQNVEK